MINSAILLGFSYLAIYLAFHVLTNSQRFLDLILIGAVPTKFKITLCAFRIFITAIKNSLLFILRTF